SRGSKPRPRATPSQTSMGVMEGVTKLAYRPLAAVVLAAGEGTRMKSATPKVLHPLCGRPMILHVLDRLVELPLARIVIVVGHGAERGNKTVPEQLVTAAPG